MKQITLVLCLLMAIVSRSQIPQLFTTTTDTGFVAEVFDSTVIIKQNIVFNINNLKTQDNDTLRILLPGVTTPVNIIKTSQGLNTRLNSFEWFGKISGAPNSFVILTNINSVVAGYIRDDNKIYRIEYRGNNVHQIASINNKYAKPDKVKHITSVAGSSYITDSTSCCDTIKEIDIMVVYTAEARLEAGGTEGILTLIDLCVQISNTSYFNSGINARLILVHAEEINYTDQSNADTNIARITNNPGGIFNNVYELRNRHKADIVVLIVNMMYGYAGIANVMTTNTVAFENSAFAVVSRRESAASNLVFTHEVGHVMGAGHDQCNADWEGLYNYSHGYAGANYNTIMSGFHNYNRIEYWSNPNIIYPGNGLPMGTSLESCATNNAYTLNNTINTVSKFRCREGSQCSKPPCKWYTCWIFWVALLLASIIILLLILRRKRRRPRP